MAISDIDRAFAQLGEQGQKVCAVVERGQARTPLADHFGAIEKAWRDDEFSVLLLGVDQASRTALLSWLLQQDMRVLALQDKDDVGLIELSLKSSGYSIETAAGQHLDFTEAEAFLDALSASDIVQSGDDESWVDPVKLALPAPSGVQGLKLFMPRNMASFVKNPSLMTRVLAETDVAVMAAPAEYAFSDDEKNLVQELAPNLAIIQPVIVGTGSVPPRGWWQDPRMSTQRGPRVEPIALPQTGSEEPVRIAPFLADTQNPLRRALRASFHCRQFQGAIEAVAAIQKQELEVRNAKRKKEDRRAKVQVDQSRADPTQSAAQELKDLVQDDLSEMALAFEAADKKAKQKDGAVAVVVSRIVEGLTFDDLEQEKGSKTIRLGVPDSVCRNLASALASGYRKTIGQDLAYVRDGLGELWPKLEAKLTEIRGQATSLDLEQPDETSLWESLSGLFVLSINYKGTMPKRGFFQRLGEGRRAAFGVLMAVSILGVMFGSTSLRSNPLIGLAVLVIFLGSIIYSYFSWSREDREKQLEELEKARTAIETEIGRMFSEVQREKAVWMRRFFDGVRKQAQREVEGYLKAAKEARVSQSEEDRSKGQINLKNIDQKIRELSELGERISRLRQAWRELEGLCRTSFRDAAQDKGL